MDEQTIMDRARIIDGIDAPARCDTCDTVAPDDVATDARWFIDSEMIMRPLDERAPSHLVMSEERAIIRCPVCW